MENSNVIDFIKSPIGVMSILGLTMGGLFACSFILGAWYSCNEGEGTLSGLKCLNVEVTTACEKLTGERYIIPVNRTNISTIEFINATLGERGAYATY